MTHATVTEGVTPADAATASPADLNAAVSSVEADILGVRLGMSPDEVGTALNENKPDNVQLLPRKWSSMDPAHASDFQPVNAETPGAFVPGIRATGPGSTHEIQVTFAKPPADNVVESIMRKELYSSVAGQQTSLEAYRQSLIEKYGTPTEEDQGGAIVLIKWLYPDSASDCTPLKSNLPAKRQMSNYPKDMGHLPETCATTLVYSLTANGGIVSNMEAKLANVGQEYFNREAMIAHRDALNEQAAEAQRQQATDRPNL